MKFAIITAIWQREPITKIFLKSVQRYWQDYGIQTMIAGSEGVRTRDMCLDAGAGYTETPNEPLSKKWNQAIMGAWIAWKPDGFILMGSDDFMNDKIIETLQNALIKGIDVAGFRDCYFYNSKTGEAGYWAGYSVDHRRGESIGMGRLLSAKAFKALGGRPWSHARAGLDWIMMQRLKKQKFLKREVFSVKDVGGALLDVKGFGNLSGYTAYQLEPFDMTILDTIPEFSEIKSL